MSETSSTHDFDFWVGEWDVFGPKGKQVGRNSITLLDIPTQMEFAIIGAVILAGVVADEARAGVGLQREAPHADRGSDGEREDDDGRKQDFPRCEREDVERRDGERHQHVPGMAR